MTIDEDINLFSPLGCKPPEDGMYITGKLIRKMHEEHKKQEKEKAADNTKKLLSGLYKSTAPKVIHDESVVGIYQDKLTGDVILGQPQPVTTVDQSFSMRGITQFQSEDDEIKAVVKDPLIKKVRITGTSIPVPDVPLGLTIIPKGMFNRMRYEVWKYALDHLDKSDKIEFPFNDDTVYTVWTCKTLQNWKALISTNLPDGMYYECTYNGDTQEMYLDAYKKFENKTIKIEQSNT